MVNPERFLPEICYSDEDELAGQTALGEWAKSHANDLVSVLPYDPELYPFQRLDVIHLEPKPNLDRARQFGELGIGKETYNNFLADLQRFGLIKEVHQRARRKESSLMATAHLHNIIDTPLGHNAAFVASGDEDFADINVLVANHMVKRLQIRGAAVPEIIQASGHIVFGHPLPGARDHGLPEHIIQTGNRALNPILVDLLERGVLFHRAPTDTRASDIELEDGVKAKSLPVVDASFAHTVKKRMPFTIGAAIDVRPGRGSARLLSPIQIFRPDEIHYVMTKMTEALTEISGEPVFYGMPEGARLI